MNEVMQYAGTFHPYPPPASCAGQARTPPDLLGGKGYYGIDGYGKRIGSRDDIGTYAIWQIRK